MSRTSRRRFLRAGAAFAATGSALALFPWLQARAQGVVAPRRLLLVFTPHGTVWDQWRPTGGETGFTFSPILAPLERHRSRLVIMEGTKLETGTEYYIPHTYTMPLLWTGSPIDTVTQEFCREDHNKCFGWNTGVSVDQFIASELAKLGGTPTPYTSIELGYGCGGLHPATRMIYTGPGQPRSPLDDPNTAFNTLFGTISSDIEQAKKDALRRKSVLDAVLGDFNSRRATLTAKDKARLDAHADSIRELELTLEATCQTPLAPGEVNSQTAMDEQSKLLAAALGCGLTRVASFQLRIADNDNTLYPWLGLDQGGHHTVSHDSGAAAQATLAKVYTWYSERIAFLLDRLAETPDIDGRSVLDNTFVIWGSELGRGWDHDIKNVPFVFAGATDILKAGRYMSGSVIEHNRILVAACHAMGLTDVQQYGSLDDGSGPVPGLFL
jgi:hypothetical protein